MRRRKNGTLAPLFINTKSTIPIDKWLTSECYPTKGFTVRKGWHCTFKPHAPHLVKEPRGGSERVWVKVEVENYTTFDRPESQGGSWILADKMRVVEIIG